MTKFRQEVVEVLKKIFHLVSNYKTEANHEGIYTEKTLSCDAVICKEGEVWLLVLCSGVWSTSFFRGDEKNSFIGQGGSSSSKIILLDEAVKKNVISKEDIDRAPRIIRKVSRRWIDSFMSGKFSLVYCSTSPEAIKVGMSNLNGYYRRNTRGKLVLVGTRK